MPTRKFLRRRAASDYLHDTHGLDRAPSTLAKLAVVGGGPPFRRIGRVPLYSTDDLDQWVGSKLSEPMRSTSDTAASKGGISEESQLAAPRAAVKRSDRRAKANQRTSTAGKNRGPSVTQRGSAG
jgi:hypothetical protein